MNYVSILDTFEKLRIELEYAIADFQKLRTDLEYAIGDLENKKMPENLPVKVADFIEARSKRLLAQQAVDLSNEPASKTPGATRREPTPLMGEGRGRGKN